MKQLRTFLSLLAIVLIGSICSKAQANGQTNGTATLEATTNAFSKLHIVGGYDAKLIPGDKFGYVATCDAEYIENLSIKMDGSELKASIKAIKDRSNIKPTLVITYPKDHTFQGLEIHLSAGAKLDVKEFSTGDIKIKVIAGSTFKSDAFTAHKAQIDLDAGSNMEISKATVYELDIDSTSGSDITLNNVDAHDISIDSNSGADCTLEGKAAKAVFDLSSAARIQARSFNVDTLEAKASSGASISVGTVNKAIEAKATTGGSISYGGNPSTNNVKQNSGGSVNKR